MAYRKSRQEFEEETHRGLLLMGSLPGSCLSAFFLLPRPTCLGHDLQSTQCPADVRTGQSDRGNSSAEFLFSRVCEVDNQD